MATELTDRQNFAQYCNSNANYLVSANRNGLCKHILASLHLLSKNEKLKIMKLFKYRLPWQPNHQIVSYFTKRAYSKQNISPKQRNKLIILAHIT